MVRLNSNRSVTIECVNACINLDLLMDLAFFRDSAGFYYEVDLFSLAEYLERHNISADEFYDNLKTL